MHMLQRQVLFPPEGHIQTNNGKIGNLAAVGPMRNYIQWFERISDFTIPNDKK